MILIEMINSNNLKCNYVTILNIMEANVYSQTNAWIQFRIQNDSMNNTVFE